MDSIIAYFNGERVQCTIGAIASILLIACSIFFLFQQKVFLKGIAYAVIPLATLLLVVCLGVLFGVSNHNNKVTTFYNESPGMIQSEEIPRVEQVIKTFSNLMKVEIAIGLIGLILAIVFWNNELIKGIAIGLMLMGLVLLTFDFIAESRAEKYLILLKSI
ncbi:hypothetical protein SAMN04488519_10836 [Algoriphagus ornithinivorans]|uniref:Uncharacterized protein n=1 Tax=Algoriphagus ornithinivorans TaxID=226506 RepID=A0A1I5I3G8_9BACT|nr:hypothetical protein [Algoriphagus ornithinivorans]SFO54666.1 hypothetical protein SAMN04488519_10836 [Algoriphagus ornithinivorans]